VLDTRRATLDGLTIVSFVFSVGKPFSSFGQIPGGQTQIIECGL